MSQSKTFLMPLKLRISHSFACIQTPLKDTTSSVKMWEALSTTILTAPSHSNEASTNTLPWLERRRESTTTSKVTKLAVQLSQVHLWLSMMGLLNGTGETTTVSAQSKIKATAALAGPFQPQDVLSPFTWSNMELYRLTQSSSWLTALVVLKTMDAMEAYHPTLSNI